MTKGKTFLARARKKGTAEDLKGRFRQWSAWIRANVPPGVRAPLGLLLIVGGVFGFLPVLGFWMIPLGIVVLAMDVAPLLRTIAEPREKRSSKRRSGPEAQSPEERPKPGRESDRSQS